MDENPYQSPQASDSNRPRYRYRRRFAMSLWEVAVLSWIVTILFGLITPATQPAPFQPPQMSDQGVLQNVIPTALGVLAAVSICLTLAAAS